MSSPRPRVFAIDPDDYHARHVGHTDDGRQFFLTTPFEPAIGGRVGAEFVALYIFDSKGQLSEAKIDNLGPRASMDDEEAKRIHDGRLRELGQTVAKRITIAPFSVERFGTEFGLVLREPAEEGDPWAVEAQPGNYMAFFEPWDSGVYDT